MPDGSSKKFTCSDLDLTITWYTGEQNSLVLHGESSSDLAKIMIKVCQKTLCKDFTGMTALSVNGVSINNPLDRAISLTTSSTNSTSELLATSVNDAPTPKELPKTDIQMEDHSHVSPKSIYQKSLTIHQFDSNCKLLAVELGGVKLEMVLMQKGIESKIFIANKTKENDKIKGTVQPFE